MAPARKIVLNSVRGKSDDIYALVREWIEEGVTYVGVVGKDASILEDMIDEECGGDGSSPYFMLTASHEGETLEDAIALAEMLSDEFPGPVHVVGF